MSVCLPNTECEAFASHIRYTTKTLTPQSGHTEWVDKEHVLLVGKPSTALEPGDGKCEAAIARREALFEKWREYYRSVSDPAADRRETLVD